MKKVIGIVGPTGVGKTKMSIELAKKYDGEIINADSMQVYKRLNIGTAKVTESEKEGIPHHLFDIKEPNDSYSVYQYQQDGRKKIQGILNKNKTPIIVGGTGLYIKALLYDYEFKAEEEIINDYEDLSNEDLYKKLLKIDHNTNLHANNRKRVIRALNYYDINKIPISSNNKSKQLLYDCILIGLTRDREALYESINNRVDNMMDNGLLEEVEDLYKDNVRSRSIETAIGYKELYQYFDNNVSLAEAIENIKQNSRRYAKKQYTWFNNQMDVNWVEVDINNFNKTIEEVINYIDN